MGAAVRIVDGKVVADPFPTVPEHLKGKVAVSHSIPITYGDNPYRGSDSRFPVLKATKKRRGTTRRMPTSIEGRTAITHKKSVLADSTKRRTPIQSGFVRLTVDQKGTTYIVKIPRGSKRTSKPTDYISHQLDTTRRPSLIGRGTPVRKTTKRKTNRVQRKSKRLTTKRNIVYGATKAKRRSLTDDLW